MVGAPGGIFAPLLVIGAPELALPLLLASLVAHGVAWTLGGRPIYASLLERERGRSSGDGL